MIGLTNSKGGSVTGNSLRVTRPFDQADIDDQPVETPLGDGGQFFIQSGHARSMLPPGNAPEARVPDDIHASDVRYGADAGLSLGEDIERASDA